MNKKYFLSDLGKIKRYMVKRQTGIWLEAELNFQTFKHNITVVCIIVCFIWLNKPENVDNLQWSENWKKTQNAIFDQEWSLNNR